MEQTRPPSLFSLWGVLFLLLLAACGPMSPEHAARVCEERARGALGPSGYVAAGISTAGPRARGEIGVTSDYLQGRDPQRLYEQCVRARSGQGPIRPPRLTR